MTPRTMPRCRFINWPFPASPGSPAYPDAKLAAPASPQDLEPPSDRTLRNIMPLSAEELRALRAALGPGVF